MKRREFLNAALAGMAAMTLVPIPTKAVPFSEVFQPAGPWEDITPGDFAYGDTVKTLDDVFKKVYADKIRFDLIPRQIRIIEHNQGLLSEPVFCMPVTLKHENGFTHAD